MKTPAQQLDAFLAKHDPAIVKEAKQVLAKMRKLTPGAIEMVYDNYNFLVVGFCPSERPSEAVFSIVFYPRGVSLCFIQGAKLPDPHRVLAGSGKQVRSIKLPTLATLENPLLRDLIATALKLSPMPFSNVKRRQLIIKSISTKQRPRRIQEKAR